eukprot:m.312590 g.312590  ORF g.312590 m.312590 type:complete len:123 (-) comp16404_c2_seq16:603-971(-)
MSSSLVQKGPFAGWSRSTDNQPTLAVPTLGGTGDNVEAIQVSQIGARPISGYVYIVACTFWLMNIEGHCIGLARMSRVMHGMMSGAQFVAPRSASSYRSAKKYNECCRQIGSERWETGQCGL